MNRVEFSAREHAIELTPLVFSEGYSVIACATIFTVTQCQFATCWVPPGDTEAEEASGWADVVERGGEKNSMQVGNLLSTRKTAVAGTE